MKNTLKIIGLIILIVISVMGYKLYDSFYWYKIECSIHSKYFPILMAIYDYSEKKLISPNDLNDLVPGFIKEIPRSEYASSINYTIIDKKGNWEFFVESNVRGAKRKYIHRSNESFSAKEKENIVLEYHSYWTVLKED